MIEAQLQEAQKAAQEASSVMSADEAVTKHQLSLYAHITRVTWRSDQQPLVAGTVSDSSTGDIRLFSFDSAATSRFELVNALWELL
ncbi:hypothetical protein CHLRE_12g519850v5 [Chlamydomonas reinhardtii]|uniref:Kinetochore protein Spc24 n=1 Tax=Chlamydomonas reinhardtii TaxID=3055 RepID=A8J620_CHLRE|nr:uncharacterized protein CHLRE_12g519850v5 [Chlamydomonas reinhardtii]PNW75267.1 hypothetical protein CHLRE_12g519850v5 [Chlamydomonas reinhardtii]|eukprot:XP_001697066.1 predicted protein [Chlamydomonas reinhardtii]